MPLHLLPIRARARARARAPAVAPELSRLNLQFSMNRGRGTLRRQLVGFAIGPALYIRSLLWARRLGLRDVIPAEKS